MITVGVLLLLGLCCQIIQAQKEWTAPILDARSPKNIGFGAVGGGSSHYLWVMEILQELTSRGHVSTLYTRKDSLRFAKDYPNVQTQAIGGDANFLALKKEPPGVVNPHFKHPNHIPAAGVKLILPALLANYSNEYNDYMSMIKRNKIDLMICDMFAFACIDATTLSKVPLTITSTVAFSEDATTGYVNNIVPSFPIPTTEYMTIWGRFKYFFHRVYTPYVSRQLQHPTHEFQKQQGLPISDSIYRSHKDAYKIVNNMFGLEVPRPLGPLVQMVGPILRKKYDALTPALTTFLDSHRRVAYVAFGQHAVPTEQDTEFLVHSLVQALKDGHLDGVIWASAPKHPVPVIPRAAEILVTGWAPQFAILQHPSTVLFVTHGGAGSVHEALFNKVPLFVFPFFGDQPVTARMVRQQYLGDYILTAGIQYTKATLEELTQRIRHVLTDPTIKRTVSHFGDAVQIRSLHAVQRAADLIEELTVAAIDGKVLHLSDVGRRISWVKRHNLDLVGVSVGFAAGLGWFVCKVVRLLKISKKLKTL